MTESLASSLLAAALAYAARGWHVIPVYEPIDGRCACREAAACEHPAKHPRTSHGVKDATTDPEKIRKWWTRWPKANIGIATDPSGLVVLDVDPKRGGEESLEELIASYGSLDDTEHVLSGGGGSHYYFAGGKNCINTATDALGPAFPGIDILAAGANGHIIAPPSRHLSGGRYILEASSPDKPLPVPEWLVNATAGPRQRTKRSRTGGDAESGKISEGGRNTWLAGCAGALRIRGVDDDTLADTLCTLNAGMCRPPLSETEVATIARSYAKYPDRGWDEVGEGLARIRKFTKSYDDIDGRADLQDSDKRVYSYILRDAEMRADRRFRGCGLPMSACAIGRHFNMAERTIVTCFRRLENRGLIVPVFRSNGGKHKTNLYKVVMPAPPDTAQPSQGSGDATDRETLQPLQVLDDVHNRETLQPLQGLVDVHNRGTPQPLHGLDYAPNRDNLQPLQSLNDAASSRHSATDDTKLCNGCRPITRDGEKNQGWVPRGLENEVMKPSHDCNKTIKQPRGVFHESDDEREALLGELVALNVPSPKADALVAAFQPTRIRQQIAWLPQRLGADHVAVLVKAIEDNWRAPKAPSGT